MLGCQRGPGNRYGIFKTGLVGHDGIGIAFGYYAAVVLADFQLGKVEPVQDIAFIVQKGLGSVNVLCRFFGLLENPAAKSDDLGIDIKNGKYNAAAEAVIRITAVFCN